MERTFYLSDVSIPAVWHDTSLKKTRRITVLSVGVIYIMQNVAANLVSHNTQQARAQNATSIYFTTVHMGVSKPKPEERRQNMRFFCPRIMAIICAAFLAVNGRHAYDGETLLPNEQALFKAKSHPSSSERHRTSPVIFSTSPALRRKI